MSVNRAIAVGLVFVNGPVLVFLLGPLLALDYGNKHGLIPRDDNWLVIPGFLVGFVIAWLWWSITVPRWRLWAYERVSDIAKLKETAVAVGLTWPKGSRFTRTEIKSKAHEARERRLDTENETKDSE